MKPPRPADVPEERRVSSKPHVPMLPAPRGRNLLANGPVDHIHHHSIGQGRGDDNGVALAEGEARTEGAWAACAQ